MTPWKRRILYMICIGAVFGGILGGFYLSSQQVPSFYVEALADANVTLETAELFEVRTSELLDRIEESPGWQESFTEQEINSWLAYEFPRLDQSLVPAEVSQPRVRFIEGSILAACRYEGQEISGVLNFEIRPSVTENHELALELVSARVGLIPIPMEKILHEVTRDNHLEGVLLELVEIDGREVLKISAEHPVDSDSAQELTSVEVEDDQITLSGQSRHHTQTRLSGLPTDADQSVKRSN